MQQSPEIKWDGKTWFVSLPVEGKALDAKWVPNITYVVRVREVGTEQWSIGFETPLTHCTIVDLKPDTEYEMQLQAKNAAGKSEPTYSKVRTNSEGTSDNVIPFPKR